MTRCAARPPPPGSWARRRPRAVLLGMLVLQRGLDARGDRDAVLGRALRAGAADGARSAARLAPARSTARRRMSRAIFPNGSTARFARAFGDDRVPEVQALAARAPLDLRVNTLKATREQVQERSPHLAPRADAAFAVGLRIALGEDGRGPGVHAEPEFLKGWFEIQDEGSQLAALLTGVKPGEQVVDLCAGAGGKTLALAALMENKGQIYATDSDARRLAPIHERLARAGARNVQVRTPRGRGRRRSPTRRHGSICVLVDAPCTGTGTWRRNPDAKWRLRPGSLDGPPQGAGRGARPRRAAGANPAGASSTSPARCCRRRTTTRSSGPSRSTGAAGHLEPPRARTRDPPRGSVPDRPRTAFS